MRVRTCRVGRRWLTLVAADAASTAVPPTGTAKHDVGRRREKSMLEALNLKVRQMPNPAVEPTVPPSVGLPPRAARVSAHLIRWAS